MDTFLRNNKMTTLKRKGLVLAISAMLTNSLLTSVTQASDVQIYQNPTATSYPIIMLAIDNSFSMAINDASYNNAATSRLSALKSSLVYALNARNVDGSYKIPDRAYIGLSKFAGDKGSSGSDNRGRRSRIAVQAQRLDTLVGTTTQRQYLINQINALSADSSTPTATLFADTYAYLLGSRTDSPNSVTNLTNGYQLNLQGMDLAVTGVIQNNKYIAPIESLSSESDKQCSTQGVFFLTDGAPSGVPAEQSQLLLKNTLGNANIPNKSEADITCTDTDVPAVYYNYSNARGTATSNGEFFQMALSPSSTTPISSSGTVSGYQDRSGWSCIANLVRASSNASRTSKKRIYLSTVGYGPLFAKAAGETCQTDSTGRNVSCVLPNDKKNGTSDTSPYSNTLNADALKMLGDKVGQGDTYGTSKPIGGYTFANTGEKVQDALLKFVKDIDAGSFDAASFGTYVVPADPLATTSSYNAVLAPQFQPKISGSGGTVQSTQQLWVGNLKKYTLNSSGVIVDKNGATVLNSAGSVIANTRDYWNADTDTSTKDGKSALEGGLLSGLTLPNANPALLNTVTASTSIKTRPLYIDATIPTTGTTANNVVGGASLTALNTTNVLTATTVLPITNTTITGWRRNSYQPYLLSALGFKLDLSYLNGLTSNYIWDSVDKVKNLNVMQQMGGVIHSDPLLVTLEAKYDATTGAILANTDSTTNRKDYIIVGTLQGLLHMVDQSTGKEVFSFLPNEILQDQNRRDALLDISNSQVNTTNPYYGIDAPWASWVEYQVNNTSKKFLATTANVYGGMRMGGKSYYGLNVKDPTDPEFLFQIDPSTGKVKSANATVNATAANPAISAMGQSWSKPTLAKIRFGNSVKKVMIVGGGYDPAYEGSSYQPTAVTASSPNAGAGVYIFDATTGALLWNARAGTNSVATTDVKNSNLKYSVVSQIKAFDRDADGLVDNLYFGDLGGQVFRVDLNNAYGTATTNYGRVNRLADFSASNQKFYEMPALSVYDNNGSRFGVISLASGNRSNPLNVTNGADNRIYALYDYDLNSTNLFNSSFTKTSDVAEGDLLNWADIATTNVGQLTANTKKGWYYVLRKTTGTMNETANTGTVKALNGYLVVANTAKFSDFYVSLYNPNDSSTQQPDACTGGITGSSMVKRLCLPYGVCGDDLTLASNYTTRETDGTKKDGIVKVQAGGFVDPDGKNIITLVPNVGRNYKTTKIFQSSNWTEK
ncbi:pilus assembly protein [Acinetobacter wuhouensis]|uniref:Pilus assembly protein PilY n=1 Tax=Acinetobacter wuhouensis TaxID=1879050 RepID=A0A4Q7APE0_9GAMM|nr:PilC/PilY family type IV pilus protein [Acinetobacter wuhouensis]RZG49118.1 pilus assembly protein PilY [Acinetobacter wuhouensis]